MTIKRKGTSRKTQQSPKDIHLERVREMRERLEQVKAGGGEAIMRRHHERGKFSARERIEAILDPDSSFVELSSFAAWGMYEDQVPSAGIVTGIGRIHGKLAMFVANDATVKGGTYYPMTAKKHLRAQEIAMQNRLPCVYLVDSGGAFLPMQDEVFPDRDHFGRVFYYQARMSALGIPQIAAVLGSCTAGGAYIPAMADEAIIVKGNGTIFLGGPPLVEAATGEKVSAQELGGAEVHGRESGVADHIARDEEHALEIVRSIFAHLPDKENRLNAVQAAAEPRVARDAIYEHLPVDTTKEPFEIRKVIEGIVDASEFFEFKKDYGTTLVCGFAHLGGMPVGILANNGILFNQSSLKGAHFIQMCEQRRTPLLFLQNITGFMIGKKAETEGIAKNGAKMVMAVANATVPKITLIVGGSFGAGNYGMCGRAYAPNYLYVWPNAKTAVMGGEQAADVLWRVHQEALKKRGKKPEGANKEKGFKAPILEKYARESDAYYGSARLWDDGIIPPEQTREVLMLSLASCLDASDEAPGKYGVFRM